MMLFRKVFTNEHGNEITLALADGQERGTVIVTVSGPHSKTTNTVTWREVAELRDALKYVSLTSHQRQNASAIDPSPENSDPSPLPLP